MERLCPVWAGYALLNPLRKLFQHPRKILQPYVREGMRVLDVGSAMGYFSIPIAQMVGNTGMVYCIDVQQKMLDVLRRRAARRGLQQRIQTRLARQDSLEIDDLQGQIDFALAFAVVHEVPDRSRLLREIAQALKPRAMLLVAEPLRHASRNDYRCAVGAAMDSGLVLLGRPRIRRARTALFQKPSHTS